jgi:hypothetical protein
VRLARALPLLALAACAQPRYLGAKVPKPCTAGDAESCLGWMAERELAAAELDLDDDDDDAALRRYVQQIANRLTRASLLDRSPRMVISDHEDTYATSGHRIVIARRTIEQLGSEAELAGVIAHELAHVEGRHGVVSLFGRPPDEGFVHRRDAEAVADERAVWLLERAGYAPAAMATALRAVLEAEDEEHPLRADRIARVTVLAGGPGGFVGRDELLRAVANMVVGRDPRLGRRHGGAWVVAALGLAFQLEDTDLVRVDSDILAIQRERATVLAYAVGAPWGRELAATLENRERVVSDLGTVTLGTIPYNAPRDDSPLGKLARAVRRSLPQPAPGTRAAILVRPRGALVIEITGRTAPALALRSATDHELASAEPARLVVAHAPRAGMISELGVCAHLVDDPDRVVRAGEPIKCAESAGDRRAPRAAAPAGTGKSTR